MFEGEPHHLRVPQKKLLRGFPAGVISPCSRSIGGGTVSANSIAFDLQITV
jgi:hypothetical protein